MACSGCKKGNTLTPDQRTANSADFSKNVPIETSVTLDTGTSVPLKSLLVTMQPPTGWNATFTVKGASYTTKANNPSEIVKDILGIYKLNNVEIAEDTIWANLNLQWLSQSPKKFRKVSLEDFNQVFSGARSVTPESSPVSWGAKGWGIMQIYLAGDIYSEDTFNNIMNLVADLLRDPYIGCEECYTDFAEARSTADISTRDKARLFVFNLMNSIRRESGRPTFTKEKAYSTNLWF